MFAMKVFDQLRVHGSEQQKILSEFILAQALKGPTFLQYHETFVENYNLYVLMDYAEGGSLSQLIQKRKSMNKKFTEDEILMYVAQMAISLLLLHTKNIIHRNFSNENLFIQDGVLKVNNMTMYKQHVAKFGSGKELYDGKYGYLFIQPPEKW